MKPIIENKGTSLVEFTSFCATLPTPLRSAPLVLTHNIYLHSHKFLFISHSVSSLWHLNCVHFRAQSYYFTAFCSFNAQYRLCSKADRRYYILLNEFGNSNDTMITIWLCASYHFDKRRDFPEPGPPETRRGGIGAGAATRSLRRW